MVLAQAYDALATNMLRERDHNALAIAKRARDLIAPLAGVPGAPDIVCMPYAAILTAVGSYSLKSAEALKELKRAMEIAASLGARENKTLEAAATYVSAAAQEAGTLYDLGRSDEALADGIDADRIGRRVLEIRPDYRSVQRDVATIGMGLSLIASDQLDPSKASVLAQRAIEVFQRLMQGDPSNVAVTDGYSWSIAMLANFNWEKGDIAAAVDFDQRSANLAQKNGDRGAADDG